MTQDEIYQLQFEVSYVRYQFNETFLKSMDGKNIPLWGSWNRKEVGNLLQEIDRLKRGEFTEEEFQNLCHNWSEDDICRFKQGCEDYQRKLFGFKKVEDEREKDKFKKKYEGKTVYCCECSAEYPMYDLVVEDKVFCEVCRKVKS